MNTIAAHIATIRSPLKLDTADIRLTDRDIYQLMESSSQTLIKRADSKLTMMFKDTVFKPACFQLLEVDPVQCCLTACLKNVKSDCRIKRTKERLPDIVEGDAGHLIYYVANLDGTVQLTETTRASYSRKVEKSTFKYDPSIYYFEEDGYLYFPDFPRHNIDWQVILVSAYFKEDPTCDKKSSCANFQDSEYRIPADLVEPMYRMCWETLGVYKQVPTDPTQNKNENG